MGVNEGSIIDFEALQSQVDTQASVQDLEREKAITIEDEYTSRIQKMNERLLYITNRLEQLDKERGEVASSMDKLQDQVNGLLLKGVSQAAGLPVDLSTLAGDASLDQKLLSAGEQLLVEESGDLTNAIKGTSDGMAKAVELYTKAQEIKKDIDQGKVAIEQVQELVRKPTFENLLKAGTLVYDKLDPADQQKISEAIQTAKPVAALVTLMQNSGDVKAAAVNYILDNHALNDQLSTLIDYFQTQRQSYSKLVCDLAATANPETQKESVKIIAYQLPDKFLASLPPSVVKTLQTSLGVSSDSELQKYLSNKALDSFDGLKVQNGTIMIGASQINSNLQTLCKKSSEFETDLDAAKVKSNVTDAMNRYLKIPGNSKEIFDKCPNTLIEMRLKKDETAGVPIFDGLLSKVPTDKQETIMGLLVKQQVGSDYVSNLLSQQQPSSAKSFYSGIPSVAPMKQESSDQQAIMAIAFSPAVAAIFPQAAMAAMAVKVIQGINEIDHKIAELKMKDQEFQALTVEMAQIRDQLDGARLTLALAKLDRRIAEQIKSGALRQYEIYRQGIRQNVSSLTDIRAKIKLRLALTYFLAELLRQELDAFDRSIALWFGDPREPRGNIAKLVLQNPLNIRYILDPEIQLDHWLNEEDKRQRENIDGLSQYWKQMVTLCDTLCNQLSCQGNNPAITAIAQTGNKSLKDLVSSSTWSDFLSWQKNPGGKSFTFTFLLYPSKVGIPSDRQNVRVVWLGAGATLNEQMVKLNQFKLVHTGVGYVQIGGKFIKDTMQEVSATGLDLPSDANTGILAKRWAGEGPLSLNIFEGYAPFAVWQLTLFEDQLNTHLENITFNIVYSHQQAIPNKQESQIVKLTTTSSLPIEISTTDLATLGNPEEIVAKLRKFSQPGSDGEPAVNVLGKIELIGR